MIVTIFSITTAHLLLILIGTTILVPITIKKSFRLHCVAMLSLSYILGELLLSSILLLNSHIFGSFLTFATTIVLSILGAATLYGSKCISKKRLDLKNISITCSPKTTAISLLLLLVAILMFSNISFIQSLQNWDARLIWFFHGKAFFFANHIDTGFLTNPGYIWSHPDYPPFIPLLSIYHATLLGEWNEVLNKSFLFFHWGFSLFTLYYLLVQIRISWLISLCICLSITIFYSENALIGCADSLVAISYLIAFICFLLFYQTRQDDSSSSAFFFLTLSFIFYAICSLTKAEGLIFALIAIAQQLLFVLNGSKEILVRYLKCTLVYVATIANWYLFTKLNGIKGEYSHSLDTIFNHSIETLHIRFNFIYNFTQAYFDNRVPIIIVLIVAIVIPILVFFSKYWAKREKIEIIYTSFTCVSLLLLILMAYLTSPLDLRFHLSTSLSRIISTFCVMAIFYLGILSRKKLSEES